MQIRICKLYIKRRAKMDDVLDEIVSSEDLKNFEKIYNDELRSGKVTAKSQFQYAWCLVRSRYPADIQKGIMLLEDLYNNSGENEKRDSLYYLAIGNARIKEYSKALNYVRLFLQIEPGNTQVQNLETLIKNKIDKEGKKGLIIFGGAIVFAASVLSLGIAMAKKGR